MQGAPLSFQRAETNFHFYKLRKTRDCYRVKEWLDLRPGKKIPGCQQATEGVASGPSHYPRAPGPTRPHPCLAAQQLRVHVCVSVCGMGTGAVPPEGWGLRDVTTTTANQRRARGGGAGIGAARGQFSITRSPEPAGKKEAERAEGALPAAGPGHRAPGRGPSRRP